MGILRYGALVVFVAQVLTATPSQVTVSGEVLRPGQIDWTPQMTVKQAIDLAGGLTDRATTQVFVQRPDGSLMTAWSARPDSVLQPGDKLTISRRPFAGTGPRVMVMGEVKKPGDYTFSSASNTIALAIAAAGGLASGAGTDIQVLQHVPGRGTGPITETTDRGELGIMHVSRQALDENRLPGFLLRADDDAIFVPKAETSLTPAAGHVSITGDVHTPLELTFDSGVTPLTVKTAIDKTGGPNATAGTLVVLSRGASTAVDSRRSRELVNYQDIANGSLDLVLHDGDVVDVPMSTTITVRDSRPSGHTSSMSAGIAPAMTLQMALDRFNRPNPVVPDPNFRPVAADQVKVRRQINGRFEMLDAAASFLLQPNDEIVVIRGPAR